MIHAPGDVIMFVCAYAAVVRVGVTKAAVRDREWFRVAFEIVGVGGALWCAWTAWVVVP